MKKANAAILKWLLQTFGPTALVANDLDLEEIASDIEELGYGEDGIPRNPQAAKEIAEGVLRRAMLRQATFFIEGHLPCPACEGSGKDPKGTPCAACGGAGQLAIRASLDEVLRALGLELEV